MILYDIENNLNVAINEFTNTSVVGNKIIDNFELFANPDNYTVIDINNTYKFRPDKLAFEYYGSDSLFPIILAVNNLRTLMDFIPENLNYKVKILHSQIIKDLLNI